MDNRLAQIRDWLPSVIDQPIRQLTPASADASFRRYFRADTEGKSYIVMDAPPNKEPIKPFIDICSALSKQNLHVPQIHGKDIALGFLLLEDLGDTTYLAELKDNPSQLYSDAIVSLTKLQRGIYDQADFTLPSYNHGLLEQELDVFHDWFVCRHLDCSMKADDVLIWQDTKALLIEACLEQPVVWVHRDYHSRNLMVTSDDNPGVIDFQDMVVGPVSYDLASLFKDCYIEWPRETQHGWLAEYLQTASANVPELDITLEQLVRWVDLTGLQRHLKVLGVFCRLNYRDSKQHYLASLPLVIKYVAKTSDLYPELSNFSRLFRRLIKRLT